MRCARWSWFGVALVLLPAASSARPDTLAPVHQQRYCMGTMFDVVAYHPSRQHAEQAVESAMEEIFRLDQVMSNFKADSDLSKLNREGSRGFMAVDPSLYEVIEESLTVSRLSGGTFDVTIAPLARTWKQAQSEGHTPAPAAIAAARKCVGFEKIETRAPDQVRFRSDCVEIDLGGIGKGYAVERAIAVLKASGMQAALVNSGGSSIASVGAPPGQRGWPVRLGPQDTGNRTLLLRDRSISTSEQNLVALPFAPGNFGDIFDPHSAAPTQTTMAVSVVAPSATVSDALSTTLLMLSMADSTKLLAHFEDVSAVWISPAGELQGTYRESSLELSHAH
jgi:thiamine biosynthesis lipoprotein